ncbi:MAG: tRNA (guanosine(37)-N1)-methyltransferase TrmD [Pseudobdellovibrio sp.]
MKPMKIKIVSLFPDLIQSYLSDALIAKAIKNNLLEISIINLRNFSDNSYKSVDDSPFGGGDGMLIRPDILEKALLSIRNQNIKQHVVYFSPQGALLNQEKIKGFADLQYDELILICGRYAGVDQRFLDSYVNEEISIGNYILSGGELPALVFIEAVSRFMPGVLGKLESAEEDSLKNNLLEAPQYTRPQVWNNLEVPEVLLSGNHKKISEWKEKMAVVVTEKKRPELLKEAQLTPLQKNTTGLK